MPLLVVKLVLTPVGIAAVTLAGRRWGPSVAGWLTGFPLTSGPVSVFLALEQGPKFASQAALGTLAGLIASGSFSVAYSRLAASRRWLLSAAVALVTYSAVTIGLGAARVVQLGVAPLFAGVVVVNASLVDLLPRGDSRAHTRAPAWDLPLRMAAATGFVIGITTAAAVLGPTATGLLSPFPVFGSVLATFTHAHEGAAAAQQLLRAFVIGQFAFASFFLVVAVALPRVTLLSTYVIAALVALMVNLGVRPLLGGMARQSARKT